MTEREENDIDLIEKYHKGTLSAAEQRSVKERMESDPVFAAMVSDYTDIFAGIQKSGKDKFKATVAEWEAEARSEGQNTTSKPGMFRSYWQLAAVFLLLAVAAIYIFYPVGKETQQDLYAAYFVPYEDVINTRDKSNPLLTEAIHFYNEKQYELAADRFSTYTSQFPDDLDALFYLGISLLEAGGTQESISTFGEVIFRNGLLKEQAEWYRALAYLKRGDIETCKKLLTGINREGHDYRAKAAELSGKL